MDLQGVDVILVPILTFLGGLASGYFAMKQQRLQLLERSKEAREAAASRIEEVYVGAIRSLTESWQAEVQRLTAKQDHYETKLRELEQEVRLWKGRHDAVDANKWELTERNRHLLDENHELRTLLEARERHCNLLEQEAQHWQQEMEAAQARLALTLDTLSQCQAEVHHLKNQLGDQDGNEAQPDSSAPAK